MSEQEGEFECDSRRMHRDKQNGAVKLSVIIEQGKITGTRMRQLMLEWLCVAQSGNGVDQCGQYQA